MMIIEQKKWLIRLSFFFKDDELEYHFSDREMKYDLRIQYACIPLERSSMEERDVFFRILAWIYTIVSPIFFALGFMREKYFIYSIVFFLFSVLFFVVYNVVNRKYTVFNADEGKLFVLNDDKHDLVIGEMFSRRKKQLLDWYGEIDYSNEPEVEIDKFNWLVEQDALSEEDARLKIEQIKWYHRC